MISAESLLLDIKDMGVRHNKKPLHRAFFKVRFKSSLKCNTVFLQTTVMQGLAAVNFSSYVMLRQRLKKGFTA